MVLKDKDIIMRGITVIVGRGFKIKLFSDPASKTKQSNVAEAIGIGPLKFFKTLLNISLGFIHI